MVARNFGIVVEAGSGVTSRVPLLLIAGEIVGCVLLAAGGSVVGVDVAGAKEFAPPEEGELQTPVSSSASLVERDSTSGVEAGSSEGVSALSAGSLTPCASLGDSDSLTLGVSMGGAGSSGLGALWLGISSGVVVVEGGFKAIGALMGGEMIAEALPSAGSEISPPEVFD